MCCAGDLGWDPLQLLPLEAAGARDMKTRELNNGRLAMIAVVLLAITEEITHAKATDLFVR